jgi:WD40 repeat protein
MLQGQDLKTCAIEPTQNGLIAVGGIEGQVYVGEINTNNSYRKEDNTNIKKHTGHQGAVNSIRFLDHFFMISGSSDSLILLWDLNSQGKYLNSYHDHSSEILGLDVCELNPNFFASASGDTTVKLWDIRDKKPCISTFKGSDSSVNCVKFVPGTFCSLAAGSEEGIIRLYDMRAYGILAEYGKKDEKSKRNNNNSSSNSINSICFSKSGQIIFSSSNNSNVITYWNIFNPESPLNEYKHVIFNSINYF